MKLTHVPLDKLKVSAANMRHGRKRPDLADILPSIRARGIQQPLLVRPNGKGYEVVAGRRRYFALRALAKEGAEATPVPVAVMNECGDAHAVEASLIENTARLDPDEVARWETFARLCREGRTVADIAATFGITELAVRRTLELGNLLPGIREAYRAGEIEADTVRQLTLATRDQQAAWLALHEDPEQHAPGGWQLKHWLFGAEIATDTALFPLDRYEGRIVADLFEETGYFEDVDAFWRLQNEAVAARCRALHDEGWSEIAVLDVGERFLLWQHVACAKEDGGRVFVEVRSDGTVIEHAGYLPEQEHRKRERARAKGGDGEAGKEPVAARPELTKAAQNYVALHRHAALRHALLSHPAVALRVMVAHAVAGSGLWRTTPEPQRAEKEAIAESVEASKAQALFAEERKAVFALLGLPGHGHSVVRSNGDAERAAAIFAALAKLDDADVMRVLAFVMAETLEAGTCLVEALGCRLGLDMADYWQPDETFFALLRDKAAINAMLREVAGKRVADGNVSATAKVQKGIVRDCLEGRGRKKVEGWLPRYLRFPFRAYTEAGAGSLSANANRARPFTS